MNLIINLSVFNRFKSVKNNTHRKLLEIIHAVVYLFMNSRLSVSSAINMLLKEHSSRVLHSQRKILINNP